MSRPASLIALSAIAALALGAVPEAQAGHGCGGGGHRWKPTPTPIVIHPPHPAPTVVARPIKWNPQPVAPTRQWYFGMSLQITQTQYGRGLQVASITPGSPASLSGLEAGDVLLAANGQGLQNAYSNEHGVQILQSLVGSGAAPAPTAAATYAVAPSPSLLLTVLNIRTGQPVSISVQPIPTGPAYGAPAPTFGNPAPVASRPAPAVSAF